MCNNRCNSQNHTKFRFVVMIKYTMIPIEDYVRSILLPLEIYIKESGYIMAYKRLINYCDDF